MKTLHILCDDAGLPPKLEAPIARLRARADVAVSVRTEKFSSDVGVPFPVAFLHDTGKGERLAHEFGVEAVEHMVAEMISSESIFEALVDAEVDAEIHLASSARLALKITRDLSCVQALIEALRADSTLGERAVEKFKRWANVSFDTRWAHPHEAALLALAVGIQEAYTEGVPALVATAIQTPNASWVRAWAGVVPVPEAALATLAAAVRRVFESSVTEEEYTARCAYGAAAAVEGVTPQVTLQYTEAGPPRVFPPVTVT